MRPQPAHSDDENDYIIGPESNHSMIKPRGPDHVSEGETDDRYMVFREQVDLEANGRGNLPKKRRVRRGHSSTNRDFY